MSKYLLFIVSFLATAAVLLSCKSSNPSAVQIPPTANFLSYAITLEGIPVVIANVIRQYHLNNSSSVYDTTYYRNSFLNSWFTSPDTLKLCSTTKYRGDTVSYGIRYLISSARDPDALQSYVDGLDTVEYLLNSDLDTIRYFYFHGGTESYSDYADQGGSHTRSHDIGSTFIVTNIPFTRVGDTIDAQVSGRNITFKDKSVDQYDDYADGGQIMWSNDYKNVFNVHYPLPDSAHLKIMLVLKH